MQLPKSLCICERRAALSRWRLQFVLAAIAAWFTIQATTDAAALCLNPPCPLPLDTGNSNIAAANGMFDQSSRFLDSLIRHAGGRSATWPGTEVAASANPSFAAQYSILAYGSEAGSASQAIAANNPLAAYAAAPSQSNPRYRTWFEGYGSRAHTGAKGTFAGDARTNLGGIAGIGATLAPNVSVGASIDQGRSNTDVVGGTQSSRIDLTQIGLNAAVSSGPWGLGIAGIYGLGHIHSRRLETAGEATASYGTRMWGALAELSYFQSSGNWRIVPKAGFDWTHVSMDSYAESGGTSPIAGTAQSSERARVYGAVELGYTKVVDRTNYDIGVYGKVIDIVTQRVGSLLATPLDPAAFAPRSIPGLLDARVEYATGTTLSVKLDSLVRLYAMYEGRFRQDFDSHGGTLGLEVRW